MLTQRLRRWANITPELVQRLLFTGMLSLYLQLAGDKSAECFLKICIAFDYSIHLNRAVSNLKYVCMWLECEFLEIKMYPVEFDVHCSIFSVR